MLTNRRILVTGSDGFLGKRIVKALKESKIFVREYDLSQKCDILDKDCLWQALTDIDTVVHLAAVSDLNIAKKDEITCKKVNIEGTRQLMDLCHTKKIQVFFASTCCVYGNNGVHPSDEVSPPSPTEIYARTKLESEQYITALGKPHVILRLATFYGPGMREALAPAVFLNQVMNGGPATIHGDGNQTRTFTYVDDIVSGILIVMNSTKWNPIVNISVSQSYSVLDLVETVMKVVGKDVDKVHVKDRDGQIYKEVISNDLLVNEYGWSPKITLSQGIELCYKYLIDCNKSSSAY